MAVASAATTGADPSTPLKHRWHTVGQIVVWALLTGGITGGIWTSIILLGNQARLRREQQTLGDDIAARREELARMEARLAFVESRFRVLDDAIASDSKRLDAGANHTTPPPDVR